MVIYKQIKDSMYFKSGTLWSAWNISLLVPHSELIRYEDFCNEPHKMVHKDKVIDFKEWFKVHDEQDYSKCKSKHDFGESYEIRGFTVIKCKECGFSIDPKYAVTLLGKDGESQIYSNYQGVRNDPD